MTDFSNQLAEFLRTAGSTSGPKPRAFPLFCIIWAYLTGPRQPRRAPSCPVVPVGPRRTPSDPSSISKYILNEVEFPVRPVRPRQTPSGPSDPSDPVGLHRIPSDVCRPPCRNLETYTTHTHRKCLNAYTQFTMCSLQLEAKTASWCEKSVKY